MILKLPGLDGDDVGDVAAADLFDFDRDRQDDSRAALWGRFYPAVNFRINDPDHDIAELRPWGRSSIFGVAEWDFRRSRWPVARRSRPGCWACPCSVTCR